MLFLKKIWVLVFSFMYLVLVDVMDRSTVNLNKISTSTLNQTATRPLKTGFILDKAIKELGYNPHSFEECLIIIDQQLERID